MSNTAPLVADASYLRHFWHPVCTLSELAGPEGTRNGPIGRVLLDEPLVIARLNGEVVAFPDRCAHRHAKLSLGKVTSTGRLQCPYHAWEYDAEGKCALVPACPTAPIPRKALVRAFQVKVQYDLVWVRLDSSWGVSEIPFCDAWENTEYKRTIVAEPYEWKSAAERRWENFTDFSHFASVHPGTLYHPAYTEPEIVPVDRVNGELRFEFSPGKQMMDELPVDSPLGTWTYRAAMPYSVNLSVRLYRTGKPFLLWTTSSPVSATVCRNFMIIAHADEDQPDERPIEFQRVVLAEDAPIVESQSGVLSASEVSLPTDKVSNYYRKWLAELSAAALKGKEAFQQVLMNDVRDERRS